MSVIWAAAPFIHPLISGDWSSLDDDETRMLEQFIQKHPNIVWDAYVREGEYRTCQISGFNADCYRLIRIPMIMPSRA